MISFFAAFIPSFFITYLIIRSKNLHRKFSSDSDFSGPQKFHTNSVPRVGGLSLAIGLFAAVLLRFKHNPSSNIEILLLVSVLPTFMIGLYEDLTKSNGIRIRLIVTVMSAAILTNLCPIAIDKLNIPFVDMIFLVPGASAILTIFTITGLTNAYNIIDGFNGLASMVGIITLGAISYVALSAGDYTTMLLSASMIGAIMGFFVWNYPKGLIFLGDGGAYLIGFWVASLSIMLINRNPTISPWFALAINIYPATETIFSIYRRMIFKGRHPGHPDGNHFHTLIYRRILNPLRANKGPIEVNSKTAPYLWTLTLASVVPSVAFRSSTMLLVVLVIIFVAVYLNLYKKIIAFKTPRWLKPYKL